jgi:hypothetical protein
MTQQLRDARMWHLCYKGERMYTPKIDIDLGCCRFIILIWHERRFWVRNLDQFAFYRCFDSVLHEPLEYCRNELIHRYVLATSTKKVYIRIPYVYGKNTAREMRIMWLATKTPNSALTWSWWQKPRNGVYWWVRSQPYTPADFMDGELRYIS